MRRIFLMLCVLLVFLVIATGCLQSPVPQPAPAPVPSSPPPVLATLPPAVVPTTGQQKNVTFSVTSSGNTLNVTCTGGTDAASLVSLTIQITNYDGTKVGPRTIPNPAIGSSYTFTYQKPPDPAWINIIGDFSDGTQQTVFLQNV